MFYWLNNKALGSEGYFWLGLLLQVSIFISGVAIIAMAVHYLGPTVLVVFLLLPGVISFYLYKRSINEGKP